MLIKLFALWRNHYISIPVKVKEIEIENFTRLSDTKAVKKCKVVQEEFHFKVYINVSRKMLQIGFKNFARSYLL